MKPDTCEKLRELFVRHASPPPELVPADSEPAGTEEFASKRKNAKQKQGPEPVPVLICAATKDRLAAFIELPQSVRVYVSRGLLNDMDSLLGENRYTIKPKDDVPQPRKQWRRDKESESEPASA
jgi:hypothetical protein